MRVLKSKAKGQARELDIPTENFRSAPTEPVQDKTAAELGIREIVVRTGVEMFSPVQFHKFEVGPMEAVVALKPDDKVFAKYAEVEAVLARMVEHSFEKKLPLYLDRIREVAAQVEATRS